MYLPLTKPTLPHSRSGFTLVEVLVVLFVLVLIGTMMAQAIVEAGKLKMTLTEETEFSNELRTSLQIIERDLNQTFNPRWILPSPFVALDPYNPTPPTTTQPNQNPDLVPATIDEINNRLRGSAFQKTEFWGPVIASSGIRAARFVGTDKGFSFVSASHVRVYQQKKESIYAKIKYELVLDRLVKTVNTRAFEIEEVKDAPYIQTYTVLRKVKSMKFSYYKLGNKEPQRSWDSESNDQLWEYPESVEIAFTLIGPGGREIPTTIDFKLETPSDALPQTY